jgi:tRNA(Ile)-lysidine synthase
VLIGISGGSDSVALTFLLRDLAEHGDFVIAGLAHLNHRMRATAVRDEEFCRALADRVALPIAVRGADVATVAATGGWSLEDAARRERYRFLEETAAELTANCIAVGHTQDDQAETFLMKLMRGAGLAGLGGVYPRKGAVIRPLLDVSRADLRNHLVSRGERWVEDETNDDVSNPRNRIRHRVIAELDQALGGESRPNLARAAALAREDAEWLDEVAGEHYNRLAAEHAGGVDLDAPALSALPPALGRRVVLRALRRVACGREITQEHVAATLAVSGGLSGGVDVPGGRVELRAGKAVLIQQKPLP